MNEEVRKAVRYGNECCDDGSDPDEQEMWQTIRAELTRLTAIAEGVDTMVDRLGEVTTRLEAANALLRESLPRIGSECAERHVADLVERIQSLLQGAGDEA